VEMAAIVRGPVTPVIEDTAFAAAALAALPEVIDETLWPVWTAAVKEATGAKGKALFMPLRMMITGQAHGPDMATLAPMIGRERIVKRLSGETARGRPRPPAGSCHLGRGQEAPPPRPDAA
ncbi:MAG: hypothetical protein Q8K90_00080, partial [Brevundimonas sp.]|nr:hypothetical protein [Brevundimonas sp.]